MLGKMSKKFEFVTFCTDPSKAADDARRRRLVRTQAKRYSLETPASAAEQGSTPAPGDISLYTGRFHLQVIPRRANEQPETEKSNRKHNNTENKLVKSSDLGSDRSCHDQTLEMARRQPSPYRAMLPRGLDVGRLDPFRTLSIDTGAQEELLFQYGK
jgi:hypothetical protein